MQRDIYDQARGRWRHILIEAGIPAAALTGKHGECPLCKAGDDRWRYDNKNGDGTYYCNVCGAGRGVELVMRTRGLSFVEATKWIRSHLGDAKVEAPRARRNDDRTRQRLSRLWMEASPLNGSDPASLYLARRGLAISDAPKLLRYHSRAAYRHDDGKITKHHALVAKYVAPDAKDWTLHLTFLDGQGNKAQLPKVRKLAPISVPPGGAVRLSNSAETMGIAEGIETALSAQKMFGVPVWAALSDGGLIKWQPPSTAKCIMIFGDNDNGFAGQAAAYGLAHKLRGKNYNVDVRLPAELGADWNDMLLAEMR